MAERERDGCINIEVVKRLVSFDRLGGGGIYLHLVNRGGNVIGEKREVIQHSMPNIETLERHVPGGTLVNRDKQVQVLLNRGIDIERRMHRYKQSSAGIKQSHRCGDASTPTCFACLDDGMGLLVGQTAQPEALRHRDSGALGVWLITPRPRPAPSRHAQFRTLS